MISLAVLSEPRVYDARSGHSYFLDLASVATPHAPGAGAARQRLDRYAAELADEMRRGTPEGQRAATIIRERLREADPARHERAYREEIRAMTTGDGSGATLVTPAYLTADWVPAFDVEPVFSNQCNNVPLPRFGLSVLVPAFTSGTAATTQADEGDLVSLDNPEPVAGYRQAPVQTVSTGVTLDQQLIDRGGPLAFDQALGAQLELNLNAKLDSLVLSAAVSAGATTSGAGPASAGAFLGDVAGARERAYATGTRARVTHAFVSDHVFGWLSRTSDNSGRPILLPAYQASAPAPWGLSGLEDKDRQWAGFTGHVLPGGTLLFVDENLSATGNVVVSRPATVLVATGDPVINVVTEGSSAGSLQAVVVAYRYFAAVPLVPGATQTITGYGSAS